MANGPKPFCNCMKCRVCLNRVRQQVRRRESVALPREMFNRDGTRIVTDRELDYKAALTLQFI